MAADVSVQRIEELTMYSSYLQNFIEAEIRNCTALTDLMAQKLQQLVKEQQKAQQKLAAIEEECRAFDNFYASVAGRNDCYNLRDLQDEKRELEQKKQQAANCCREINSQVLVAKNAVMTIMERTKEFQNKISERIEAGRGFLKKSTIQLQQYKDQKGI